MKKSLLISLQLLLLLLSLPACAQHFHKEHYYQAQWCNAQHGIMEFELKGGTRVDCETPLYSVEFDFAKKWAESIGQSLYYGSTTGKTPAIGLILEKPTDIKYYKQIQPLCKKLGIYIFTVN